MIDTPVEKLTVKDFETDQEVRWCPSCGDFAILKQVQMVMPRLNIPKEKIVFVSGIGCSSRFPYYMNTYGVHSIHGRAPAFASGLKISRPDLSVWIVTGDGDALSIGGNHLMHILRRNLNVNILLFNNQIYGLTKGQYSPTSELSKVTKSTPAGSLDHPFNPLAVAMGADATFIGRTMDKEARHLQKMIERCHQHQGTSLLEIYQNCNIFNDNAFDAFGNKVLQKTNAIFVEHGQPLVFGEDNSLGIKLDGYKPVIVKIGEEATLEDLWVHDEHDLYKAQMLVRFFETNNAGNSFPRPFGVLYSQKRAVYEDKIINQLDTQVTKIGKGNLNDLLRGKQVWEVD